MDGLRKSLTEEFSHLYVFNLRGNQRTSGEESRREGGKIFGSGSRTPVAITIMVKDSAHLGPCELYYHNIGDYLTQKEKFNTIEEFGSIKNIDWEKITPNKNGDWINQRDPLFENFIALRSKDKNSERAIFKLYSPGLLSGRDAWIYNMSSQEINLNMSKMVNVFNKNSKKYQVLCSNKSKDQFPKIEDIIDKNPKEINWTDQLKEDVRRGRLYQFDSKSIIKGTYRPFVKQWLYFDRSFNERVCQLPKIFPTNKHENLVISITGIGANKPFSAFITKILPDYEMVSKGQCFPLYWYEKIEDQANILLKHTSNYFDGYIRHNTITDWALGEFRNRYQNNNINKEDIFWYIYGILHSPEYKWRFSSSLKKMLTRVPFAKNFDIFCNAGRKLGKLHLNYESIEPYPLEEEKKKVIMEDIDHLVRKMTFGKKDGKTDKTVIIFNDVLILKNIPIITYDYIVNGKPAMEWIIDSYQVTIDKASGIKNDPNNWSEDPRYLIDLIKRIVSVSVETVKIIQELPPLREII